MSRSIGSPSPFQSFYSTTTRPARILSTGHARTRVGNSNAAGINHRGRKEERDFAGENSDACRTEQCAFSSTRSAWGASMPARSSLKENHRNHIVPCLHGASRDVDSSTFHQLLATEVQFRSHRIATRFLQSHILWSFL